jgi:hypothetical protein
MKSFEDIINRLKQYLKPQGTEPVVRLFLKRSTYINKKFVDKAIEELEKKLFLAGTDIEPVSNLEKIGMIVLYDSAYMDEFLKEN